MDAMMFSRSTGSLMRSPLEVRFVFEAIQCSPVYFLQAETFSMKLKIANWPEVGIYNYCRA